MANKKFWQNLGTGLENTGKFLGDTALSSVGLSNVIGDEDYKGSSANDFRNISGVTGMLAGAALPLAANMVVPGSAKFIKMGQQAIGQFNPQEQQVMAYGGYNRMSPAQLEKQEVFQTPNGQVGQVNGPTHAGGGVNMMMPENTRIFSDRLKTSRGKTYAEEASMYKPDKWQAMMNDPNKDSYSKNAAKRMMETMQGKLDRLFQEQEDYKAKKGIMDDGTKIKKNGGTMQYPGGGTTTNTQDQFAPYQDPATGKWVQNMNVNGQLWYRTEADKAANKPATKPAIMQDAQGNWIPYVPPVKPGGGIIDKYKGDNSRINPSGSPGVYPSYYASLNDEGKVKEYEPQYTPTSKTLTPEQIAQIKNSSSYGYTTNPVNNKINNAFMSPLPSYMQFVEPDEVNPELPQQFAGGGLNFKSGAAYKAWLAYGHASGEFAKTPGHQKVSIRGKAKDVEHYQGGGTTPKGITDPRLQYFSEAPLTPSGAQPYYGTTSFETFPQNYDPTIQQIGGWGMQQQVPEQNTQPQTQERQPVNPASMYRTGQGLTPMAVNDPAVLTGGFQQPNLQSRSPYGMQNAQANIVDTSNQQLPLESPSLMARLNNARQNIGNRISNIDKPFALSAASTFIGPAYDIYRGLKGGDEVNLERVNPELVDFTEARNLVGRQYNQAFQGTKKAIQQGTAGNAGTYLSNVGNAAYLRDKAVGDYYTQSVESEQNTNAQIRNQAKYFNAQTQAQEADLRQREKDIAKNTLSTGLYNLGYSGQNLGKDIQAKKMEPMIRSLLNTGDYQGVYDNKGNMTGIKHVGSGKIQYFNVGENLTKGK